MIDEDDLVQEAYLAALKAARQHDASCGASFRSYITTAVRRAIHREASQFRGPYTLGTGVLRVAAKASRLRSSGLGEREIAKRMNLSTIDVVSLLHLYRGEQIQLRHLEEGILV